MNKLILGLILGTLLFWGFCGCGSFVSEESAIKAAEDQGYSNVVITESHWLMPEFYGGSKGDDVVFDANATNPIGKKVNIKICGGYWFKGFTIRTR